MNARQDALNILGEMFIMGEAQGHLSLMVVYKPRATYVTKNKGDAVQE